MASSKIKNPTKQPIKIGRLNAVNDTITLPDSFTSLYARINLNSYYFGDIKELINSNVINELVFGHNDWVGNFKLTKNDSVLTWTSEITVAGSKGSDWTTLIDIYIS